LNGVISRVPAFRNVLDSCVGNGYMHAFPFGYFGLKHENFESTKYYDGIEFCKRLVLEILKFEK